MKTGITIKKAEYVEGYKIRFTFSDGKVNVFDYEALVNRKHEECIPYRDIKAFKKFKIIRSGSEIAWGEDWDMHLPLAEIYYKTAFKSSAKRIGKRMVLGKDYLRLRDLPNGEPADLITWMYQNKLKCIEDFDDCLCVKKADYDKWVISKK